MSRGKIWSPSDNTIMRNCMRDSGEDANKGYDACMTALPGRTLAAIRIHWSIMANPRKKLGKIVQMKVTLSSGIEGRKARLIAMIEEGFSDTTCITESSQGLLIKF